MDAQIIPPWLVSALAFCAALAVGSLRPMPWRIRLSLALPILYFAFEYLWFAASDIPAQTRIDLTRLGLLLIFGSICINAALLFWKRQKDRKHAVTH